MAREPKRWRFPPNPQKVEQTDMGKVKGQGGLQPPDRSRVELTNGQPVPEDGSHKVLDPATGMQKHYVVLSPEERVKGYVRPYRQTYRHLTCRVLTTMSPAIAETYARDPGFYTGTYCSGCKAHFPLDEFVWEGTDKKVGS